MLEKVPVFEPTKEELGKTIATSGRDVYHVRGISSVGNVAGGYDVSPVLVAKKITDSDTDTTKGIYLEERELLARTENTLRDIDDYRSKPDVLDQDKEKLLTYKESGDSRSAEILITKLKRAKIQKDVTELLQNPRVNDKQKSQLRYHVNTANLSQDWDEKSEHWELAAELAEEIYQAFQIKTDEKMISTAQANYEVASQAFEPVYSAFLDATYEADSTKNYVEVDKLTPSMINSLNAFVKGYDAFPDQAKLQVVESMIGILLYIDPNNNDLIRLFSDQALNLIQKIDISDNSFLAVFPQEWIDAHFTFINDTKEKAQKEQQRRAKEKASAELLKQLDEQIKLANDAVLAFLRFDINQPAVNVRLKDPVSVAMVPTSATLADSLNRSTDTYGLRRARSDFFISVSRDTTQAWKNYEPSNEQIDDVYLGGNPGEVPTEARLNNAIDSLQSAARDKINPLVRKQQEAKTRVVLLEAYKTQIDALETTLMHLGELLYKYTKLDQQARRGNPLSGSTSKIDELLYGMSDSDKQNGKKIGTALTYEFFNGTELGNNTDEAIRKVREKVATIEQRIGELSTSYQQRLASLTFAFVERAQVSEIKALPDIQKVIAEADQISAKQIQLGAYFYEGENAQKDTLKVDEVITGVTAAINQVIDTTPELVFGDREKGKLRTVLNTILASDQSQGASTETVPISTNGQHSLRIEANQYRIRILIVSDKSGSIGQARPTTETQFVSLSKSRNPNEFIKNSFSSLVNPATENANNLIQAEKVKRSGKLQQRHPLSVPR